MKKKKPVKINRKKLISLKKENNSITCEEIVKTMGVSKIRLKSFISKDDELVELFMKVDEKALKTVTEATKNKTEENTIIEEKFPEFHKELIEYFTGRNVENFSMNQEQKILIVKSYKNEFKKSFDSSCKYQCMYAYIKMYKHIDKLYKIKKKK